MVTKAQIDNLQSACRIEGRDKVQEYLEKIFAEQDRCFSNVKQTDDGYTLYKGTSTQAKNITPLTPEQGVQRATELGIPWDPSFAGRIIPYFASDERVDGDGDIVRQNWKFAEYEKNPQVMYNHQWGDPPIGNGLAWEVVQRSEKDYKGPALVLQALFMPKEVSEFADSMYRIVRAGFMRSGSVGFFSDLVIDVKDEEERNELGLGRWGFILDENNLLEYSVAPLPANPGSHTISQLARAKHGGLIGEKELSIMRELTRRSNEKDGDSWVKNDEFYRAAARLLFRRNWERHKDVEEPLEKFAETEGELREDEQSEGDNTAPNPEEIEIQVDPVEEEQTTDSDLIQTLVMMLGELSVNVIPMLQDIRDLLEELRPGANPAGSSSESQEDPDNPNDGGTPVGNGEAGNETEEPENEEEDEQKVLAGHFLSALSKKLTGSQQS